jgi:hypothetical protein
MRAYPTPRVSSRDQRLHSKSLKSLRWVHADSYPDEEVFLHDLADGKLQVQLPFLTSPSSWVPLVLPPVTWVDRPPKDAKIELDLGKVESSR